jgi:hypothetical protein
MMSLEDASDLSLSRRKILPDGEVRKMNGEGGRADRARASNQQKS